MSNNNYNENRSSNDTDKNRKNEAPQHGGYGDQQRDPSHEKKAGSANDERKGHNTPANEKGQHGRSDEANKSGGDRSRIERTSYSDEDSLE